MRPMGKEAYLVMCIDSQLKAQLRQQALEDSCTLSKYVEEVLLRLPKTSQRGPRAQPSDRKSRNAHLTIRVGRNLKAGLEQLAAVECRTLANFFELKLHEIVAAYEAAPIRPPCAVARRKHLRPGRQGLRARVATSLSAELKVKLRKLADEDHRDLGNFVQVELAYLVATRDGRRPKTLVHRRPRDARLVVRISKELKARLWYLALEEGRSLTDLIEMKLRKVATSRMQRRQQIASCQRQRGTRAQRD